MSIIEGSILEGMLINAGENFNSIPGLWQWNDSRERVEVSGGKVANWGDKSPQENTLSRDSILGSPYYQTNSLGQGIWVMSDSSSLYLVSNRKDYTFLHNGSKFGIYLITKNTWRLSSPVSGSQITFTNAAGTGLQGVFSTATLNGRYGALLRGGATAQNRQITNLLSPTTANPNYSPSDMIYTQSVVNFGQNVGVRVRYGNAVANLTPFFPTLPEYPQAGNQIFQVCAGNTGMTVRLGLLLIYNWSIYSDADVQAFDTKVLSLISAEQLKFQQLDI